MNRNQIELGPNPVICQKWEESEKGWGTRPDGFSLHLSLEGLRKFIKDYWDGMPDEAPDEYSRPDGTPYPLGVSDEVLAQIEEAGGNKMYPSSFGYPGSGGIDGWIPLRSLDDLR